MADPTKILVCGDWHLSTGAAKAMAKKAVMHNCDLIFQLGDFGFWPHTNPDYVHQVNRHLARAGVPLVWIDGNHENFHALYGTEWQVTPEGFWRMADMVTYAPRALRWQWSGWKFLALGGGYSIDKHRRIDGASWWREETITERNVRDCLEPGGTVDVMFTHDMPSGVEFEAPLHHNKPEDAWNRAAVRTVVDVLRPKHLFHGHYHRRQESLLKISGAPPVKIHSMDMWQGVPLDSHWTILELRAKENDHERGDTEVRR